MPPVDFLVSENMNLTNRSVTGTVNTIISAILDLFKISRNKIVIHKVKSRHQIYAKYVAFSTQNFDNLFLHNPDLQEKNGFKLNIMVIV